MIMMLLFALAAKITVSISSTNDHSFSAPFDSELRMSLKACKFLLPASLLVWLMNQSSQVAVVIVSLAFRIYSLFGREGKSIGPVRIEKRGGNEIPSLISSRPENLNNFPSAFPALSLLDLRPNNEATSKPNASPIRDAE